LFSVKKREREKERKREREKERKREREKERKREREKERKWSKNNIHTLVQVSFRVQLPRVRVRHLCQKVRVAHTGRVGRIELV
jgi:hypothetical protein